MTRFSTPLVTSLVSLVSLTMAALTVGCAEGIQETAGHHAHVFETAVRLHENSLVLHLSGGYGATSPLLLYATGDAGWFAKDKEIFNKLVPTGYPIAGFSARSYVGHLGEGVKEELPTHLADDYAGIIAAADVALGLPVDTRVVLVGKSRGAGLAVAAASVQSRLRPRLEGILAIALTREEEYVYRPVPGSGANQTMGMLQTYDALPRIGTIPVAVIQSTGDQYIPAAEARELFGPDTPTRRFRAIESANHNFDGARPEMYEEMLTCLNWIVSFPTERPGGRR